METYVYVLIYFYLVIGVLFVLSMDILPYYLKTNRFLKNWERIILIITWPWGAYLFIKTFFKN